MENLAIISSCVLASSAVACVVVLLITSTTVTRMKALESQHTIVVSSLRAHAKRLADAETGLKQSASMALKAEVADMAAAADADRARTRKEFGKLWAKFSGRGHDGEPRTVDGELDDELQAMLDLQRAGQST